MVKYCNQHQKLRVCYISRESQMMRNVL